LHICIPLRNHFARIWYIPTVALPLRLIGFEGTSQSIAAPFRSFSGGGLGIILFCNLKAEGYRSLFMKRLVVLIVILIVIFGLASGVQKYIPLMLRFVSENTQVNVPQGKEKIKIVTEESITIDIVKKAGPSVVTIAEEFVPQLNRNFPFDSSPFFGFQFPNEQNPRSNQPQSIGSGFIISSDGMIVTNKHVVSDTGSKYQIITSNDKKYNVTKIYRDPLNDVALLKIDVNENSGATLGSASNPQ